MLDVAIEAAKKGSVVATRYFNNLPKVNYKSDKSPVTKADIETEKLIRSIISRKFPDHGIVGEELRSTMPNAKYQWVIDPIDGTRSFIRGLPQWCVLIAVMENNKPIVGVCYYPHQDELFSAKKGKGTYCNGKKTKVSSTKNFNEAYINYYNLKHFARLNKVQNLIDICKQTNTSMSYASFCMNYFLKGKIDAYVCAHGLLWDFAALAILTEEAGGKFTDFSGKDSLTSETAVFSNGLIHNQVINILNSK